MKSLTMYYGSGGEQMHHDIIAEVDLLCPGLKPHYFMSVAADIGSANSRGKASLILADNQHRLGMDSGGNSLATCTEFVGNLPPKKIARYYVEQLTSEAICFAPDLPLRELEDYYSFHVSFGRFQEFYPIIKKHGIGLKVYGVVQGSCKENGEYNTFSRMSWFDELRRRHGHLNYGYAFRPPQFKNRDIVATAYFMLMGWARGEPNIHGLAIGSIQQLMVMAYIGSRAYQRLTCDATTHFIAAVKNRTVVVPIGNIYGSSKGLNSLNSDERRYLELCDCPICEYYKGATGYDLATYMDNAFDKVPGYSVDTAAKWQVCHNIYYVENAVQDINKMTAATKGRFNPAILATYPPKKEKTKSAILRAINLVDKVLEAGASEYETSSLQYLNEMVKIKS